MKRSISMIIKYVAIVLAVILFVGLIGSVFSVDDDGGTNKTPTIKNPTTEAPNDSEEPEDPNETDTPGETEDPEDPETPVVTYSEGLAYTYEPSHVIYGSSYIVTGMGECTDSDVIIPASYEGLPVVGIGDYAFQSAEITSIVIPETVTEIGYAAFDDCQKLVSVELHEGLETIDYGAFDGCSLLSDITIPQSVTYLGTIAFRNCSSLKSVVVSDSILAIEQSCFKNCTSLNYVDLGDYTEFISSYAFLGCSSLEYLYLPEYVTQIGDYVFTDSGLKQIDCGFSSDFTNIGMGGFGSAEVYYDVKSPKL